VERRRGEGKKKGKRKGSIPFFERPAKSGGHQLFESFIVVYPIKEEKRKKEKGEGENTR